MEFERLARIISEVLNLDESEIRPESELVEGLGADSLDVYQIIIGVEEELQAELSAEEAEKVRTVQDILVLADRAIG